MRKADSFRICAGREEEEFLYNTLGEKPEGRYWKDPDIK
jgi:hypothetical protein